MEILKVVLDMVHRRDKEFEGLCSCDHLKIKEIIAKFAKDNNFKALEMIAELGYNEQVSEYIIASKREGIVALPSTKVPISIPATSIEQCKELSRRGWTFTSKHLIEATYQNGPLTVCNWLYENADFSGIGLLYLDSVKSDEIKQWLHEKFKPRSGLIIL